MDNSKAKQKRANIFTTTDSGLAVMLALIIPQILIYVVLFVFGKETASSVLASALVPQISFLAVFVFLAERRKVNYKTGVGFDFKINIWILLTTLLVGLVAMFGFTALINMFDYLTYTWGYQSHLQIDVSTVPKLLLALLYVGLLPAICEELVFRGIATNGLKKYGMVTAVIVSAVFFALIHQNLQQLIYQLFLGGVMAFIMLKTGSIVYTMSLHFFNNATILVMSHISKEGAVDYSDPKYAEYYSNAWNVIWPILVAIVAIGAVIGLLFLINYLQNKKQKLQTAKVEIDEATLAEQKKDEGITGVELEQKQLFPDKKFYQNPVIISALVVSLAFWIYAIISSFK